MTEHTKEPWYIDDVGLEACADNRSPTSDERPIDERMANKRRRIACVNALAGLNPEHVGELVEAVEVVRQTSYYTDGDGEIGCTGCGHGLRDHDADCTIGKLAAALAKVKVKK